MTNKFLITTGNLKGIGLEIALKAFLSSPQHDSKVIFCDEEELQKHSKVLGFDFKTLNLIDDYKIDLNPGLYFYTKGNPFDWFVESTDYCSTNFTKAALITGPLSKDNFQDSKIKGHTSYFQNKFKDHNLFMTFIGSIYNCLLLTDHIPLLKLDSTRIEKRLKKAIESLVPLKSILKNNKPIGLLGLNPHAGENGLIGEEETEIHKKIIQTHGNDIKGPLPADGFFSQSDYERFSFLIANYHDQGLIPFKLLNGFEACQMTLGLPFVRTSVDHGTAENLYLKNKANEASLIYAYNTAKLLLEGKEKNDF